MNNENEKKEQTGTFFRFEDLRIYHKSLNYINWLQEVTSLFPDNDKSNLAPRFNNAARNIALNIAEGSARNKSQFVYYLKMAKSAIRECMVYTTISYNANLISDSYELESRELLMEMTKMIGALISSLQRANGYNNNHANNNSYHPHPPQDEEVPHERDNFGNTYDDI
jgi:four helix bundle protein